MFNALSERLTATLKSLRGKGRLSQADIDATLKDIRVALLDADVAVPVVTSFTGRIRERALGAEVSGALNPAQQIVKIVHEELIATLGGETRRLRMAKRPPTVIVLVGLQGAGKTTLAGKLALSLREAGHAPLLVAADLQRPNAVDQLQIIAEQAGVAVHAPEPGNGVGDPIQVSRDGVERARRDNYDVVIVDTAGRLAIDDALMGQLRSVRDAIEPDETLLVLDAMIGQDALATAQRFDAEVGIDGLVLAKLDGDARGGAALSATTVTGKPVLYASVGEKLTDLEAFHPDRMASRILDMGDLLSLIEQAERAFDSDQAARMAEKVSKGDDFTLEDFLEQMQALKKMGSLTKLLGMLPGMGDIRAQLDSLDDRELDRVAAIISSMTPAERADHKVLNGSRRARIAGGAGVAVSAVNQLVDRFTDAQKMMRGMRAGGGMPAMPGVPAMTVGARKSKSKAKPGKGARRSGNPAKRRVAATTVLDDLAGGPAGTDPDVLARTLDELPEAFRKALGD